MTDSPGGVALGTGDHWFEARQVVRFLEKTLQCCSVNVTLQIRVYVFIDH
jgi:hypothetical protein